MKLLIITFSPLPCYLVPLRPKYSPQHPILKHPQPTFLRQCQRLSFTPIQNNKQNTCNVFLVGSTRFQQTFVAKTVKKRLFERSRTEWEDPFRRKHNSNLL